MLERVIEDGITVRTAPLPRPVEMVEAGLSDRRHRGMGRRAADSFFPPRRFEATGLEEGIGHHRQQRMPMQPRPGSAFEVVEAEFLLHLLMGLFADPACLDQAGQLLERGLG